MICSNYRIPVASLVLGLLMTGTVSAQDDRWFKIELLIFSQESGAGASSENWDPSPTLLYPGESRFLVHPKVVAANLESYDASSEVDEFGRQILSLNPPPLLDEDGNPLSPEDELLPDGTALSQPTDIPRKTVDGQSTEVATDLPPEPELDLELEPAPLPLTPTPFIALTGSERHFRGKAAYMQRTGRYETLFHEIWVQPVASEELALPIVIDRSGDSQTWPRLQGSVKVYLSRFLHIETNFWLNTMGQYFPQTWQIPAAPLSPQSLIIEYPELPELQQADLDLRLGLELDTATELPQMKETGIGASEGAEYSMEAEPEYPWRHAVLFQQKRKMRSTEVHYLDHPMMGVVVLITPVTDEELQAMADAEFALVDEEAQGPQTP
jgi:hypothetical protein